MSTPEVSLSSGAKNKFSPFGSGGINKSLLTPCRRVGLSRKRKTPLSSLKKSFSEDLNTSGSNITSTCTENETTPLTHSKSLSRRRKMETIRDSPAETETVNSKSKNIKLSKKDLRQTFISEDTSDSNDELISVEERKSIERTETEPIRCDSVENVKKTVVRTLSDNFSNPKDACLKRKIIDDDSDDDFVVKKKQSISSKVVEKVPSSDCERTEWKCKVQLNKLSEEEVQPSKQANTLSKQPSINILDEGDFFTSTPEEEKLKKKNLQKQMKLLEIEVRQKRLKLENLQRASIYKSKHNIEELNQLTSVWLGGCLRALKDLFTLLQTHGPIDLNRLAHNMGIPKEIIAKLPLVP